MKRLKNIIVLTFILFVQFSFAQTNESYPLHNAESKSEKNLQVAAFISHTYINSDGMDGNLYVPSWGLDINYWFNHKWGIGLHNDVEIENFVVVINETEVIERVNPLVFTLDGLYEVGNGFIISFGPGVELEKNESFFLARLGLEYEYSISENLFLMATIFHDQRFDRYSTSTIGLGIGHRF